MPKTLTHHYPLPPLGDPSVPLYRGQFESDGKEYDQLVELGLQPIPRIESGAAAEPPSR